MILTLGAIIGVVTCASAQVPTYVPVPLIQNIALAASTATNLNAILDCTGQGKVWVSISTTNTKADAVNANILYYQSSATGSSNSWETTLYPIGWTTTATAIDPSNPLIIGTNLDSLGAGYIRFKYLTNACGSTTNIGVFNITYGTKKSAP